MSTKLVLMIALLSTTTLPAASALDLFATDCPWMYPSRQDLSFWVGGCPQDGKRVSACDRDLGWGVEAGAGFGPWGAGFRVADECREEDGPKYA